MKPGRGKMSEPLESRDDRSWEDEYREWSERVEERMDAADPRLRDLEGGPPRRGEDDPPF